jgi:hypothetical protein
MGMADLRTIGAQLRDALGAVAQWLRSWFWQLLATVALVALAFVLIRPFSEQRDPDAADVAAAWNDSIQRLGILPLYPPAEDFYVGDLWAVIVANDDSAQKQQPGRSTLAGLATRVQYIDLRQEMQEARQRQPIFSETIEVPKQSASFRKVGSAEIGDTPPTSQIITTLAAFPGITITHRTRGTVSLGYSVFGFSIGRDNQRIEEIRIPVAESYGVPTVTAIARLNEWCQAPSTAFYCDDEHVRRLIAFSVDNGVLALENGKYRTRIQLRLVTRVFLTREIQHRRSVVGAGSASGQAGATKPAEKPPNGETPTANSPPSLDQRVSDAVASAAANPAAGTAAGQTNGALSFTAGNGSDIEINEVFQRPVAFGYRAITIDLQPLPPKRAPP